MNHKKQVKILYSVLLLSLIPLLGHAQMPMPLKKMRGNASGLFSLGVRSTVSMFNGENWKTVGLGTGGQFRIQIANFLNSEYFADVAVSDVEGYAHREDYHIGTSFMFYPVPGNPDYSKKLKPFLETGICFDLTRIIENQNPSNERRNFSAAWPVGMGVHLNLNPRFDFTVKAQYMMHLGVTELDVRKTQAGEVVIEEHTNVSLEGHLFVSISANYKLFDIWSNKGILKKVKSEQ